MASERERIIEEYLEGLTVNDLGSQAGFDRMVSLATLLDRCKRDRIAITTDRDSFRNLVRTYRDLNDKSRNEFISKSAQLTKLRIIADEQERFLKKAIQMLENVDSLEDRAIEGFLATVAGIRNPPPRKRAIPFPLGREIAPDRRDQNFPLYELIERRGIEEDKSERSYKYWWPHGWWGDQGYEPQCVGYAWLHFLEGGPITQAPFAWYAGPVVHPALVYFRAQEIDEWPGTDYEGTSVRAGAKVLKEKGLVSSYWWADTMEEIIASVLTMGPVVVGTWWFWDMFYPDDRGFIKPTGRSAGGHAYLIDGVNLDREIFRIKNSWGRQWGRKGFAFITFEDFFDLWMDGAEACLAMEVPNGARRLAEAPKGT